jgi:hypothetical protein
MNCKKCNAAIADAAATESIWKIKEYCRWCSMPSYRVEAMAAEYAPLCPKCLGGWGIGEIVLTEDSKSDYRVLLRRLQSALAINRSLIKTRLEADLRQD